jgi:ribonucleases P/MRP protein subunit RPP40
LDKGLVEREKTAGSDQWRGYRMGRSNEWRTARVGTGTGTVLFIIYVNDIDEGIQNKLCKFADDIKMIGRVSTAEEVDELREDLGNLGLWSSTWQMSFNFEKCKVMHVGRGNKEEKYYMGGKELQVTEEEKDLGVVVSRDLKTNKQCSIAAKKGNQILGLISRTFSSKRQSIILKLYKSLVRPYLDYCIQSWRPHYQKDIDIL